MNSKLFIAVTFTSAVLAVPALAGTDPVVAQPSAPITISPTVVDTTAIIAVISTVTATTPEAQQAVAALEAAPPGSVEALTAVNSLAGVVAANFATSGASIPVLTPAEAAQAITLIDGMIAALTEAGLSTSGLAALKAAVQNRTGSAG